MITKHANQKHRLGTTLLELMIAVTLLAVLSVGFAGVFSNVAKALQVSKARSLASNLAQEQMQLLKQKAFNRILVTTSTAVDPDLLFIYDNGYYPPEEILEGGIYFTRYTYVQVAVENSGNLTYLGAVPDSGMKSIVVTVKWMQGNTSKMTQIRSITSNIDTSQLTSVVTGVVTESPGSSPITGALINMAENVGYQDTSNASGSYVINLTPGNYNIAVGAHGYYPAYRSISVAANATSTQDFSLVKIATGSVEGSVWVNEHPVISQVVGSSANAAGFCQEFVEVFNASSFTWTVFNGLSSELDLQVQRYADATPTTIVMNYTTNSIAPGSYYLFANTTPITMNGVIKNADAVFSSINVDYPDFIPTQDGLCAAAQDADSIQLYHTPSATTIDTIGWSSFSKGHPLPKMYEGAPISQVIGLQDNEQFVRRSSTSGVSSGIARVYDSNSNTQDFLVISPAIWTPKNSTDITDSIVSGMPANGAYVTATDGLSQVTNASLVGNPPYAWFSLTNVATGTWTVLITTKAFLAEIATVTVQTNSITLIPNSTTDIPWPLTGYYAAVLSTESTEGYISGWARDAGGAAISVPTSITISAGGVTTVANTTNGNYFLKVSTGYLDIIANPNNINSYYISQSSDAVEVNLGQVTSGVNFTLTQGGRIRGFVTRDGINALPGVSMIAVDASGVVRDQEVSSNDGYFTLVNLSTGDYTVEPVLGSGEVSTPATSTSTVSAGTLVYTTTFTITGAFGSLRGSVSEGSVPIKTGVLVVASTATLPFGPPPLSYNSLTGTAYYITNSYEDGSFALDVRGSTTTSYYVYAFYTKFTGSTPSISSRTTSGISVAAGATTSGINFTW